MPVLVRRCMRFVVLLALLLPLAGAALMDAPDANAAGTAVTTSSLNLRVGYRTTSKVKLVMPAGATVEIVNKSQNGYYKVIYQGVRGYAHGDYLRIGSSGGSNGGGTSGGGATGGARTTASLNLRSGPSTSDQVLLVMPPGASVSLTGQSSNGFLELTYQGTTGWASSSYISTSGGGGNSDGGSTDPGSGDAGTAYTTSSLNLRSGPSTSDRVLLVIPSGAAVTLTGTSQNGFSGVTYNGTRGWASSTYLSTSGGGGSNGGGGGGGSSNIVWPFESGGSWEIIQGYNGGTHNGNTYRYSIDLAKSGGGSAGTSILSPVSGTVLWNDVSSGGLAIDIGNGLTLCMFHVTFDSSLSRGDSVSQGQWLGTISGPGGAGYAATPHVDMTLWSSGRVSTPYSGANTISGQSFDARTSYNAYGGTVIYP